MFLMTCIRKPNESKDSFFRRKRREARNKANDIGLWSLMWCKRVLSWRDHVLRGVHHGHLCGSLLKFHDSTWLQQKRAEWVSTLGISSRNTLAAGRTGTRILATRPQVRWEDGCNVAKSTLEARDTSIKGKNSLSIGSRIREVIQNVRDGIQLSTQTSSPSDRLLTVSQAARPGVS